MRCPMHDDSNPSFGVQIETGAWVCRSGCGSGYDLAELVSILTGDPVSAIRNVLRSGALSDRGAIDRLIANRPSEAAQSRKLDPLFYERGVIPRYVLRRGVDVETARAWDLGWDPEDRAVVFPLKRDGKLLGIVRRAIVPSDYGPKYQVAGGVDRALQGVILGEDVIPSGERVYITEGPFDALHMASCGYPAVSTLGSSPSPEQALTLKRKWSSFVVAYDDDRAGKAGTRKLLKLLHGADVSILPLPSGKDPGDMACEELAALTPVAAWAYTPKVA